jgi:pimeloyl-ACP methyl ester carboxylesterase
MTETQILHVNGMPMNIAQSGTGAAVLLCHGFPETHYSWRKQIQPLADAGYRVIAPDLRGFGKTYAPKDVDRYGLSDLAGDLVGLLDALNVRDAVIVGNDWGATLAWHAALVRPDRFRAVAAVGVPMMGRPPAPPTTLFATNDEGEFYVKYFQREGEAEAELEADVAMSLRKILYAASGDAGPRVPGDATPNPFGMVRQPGELLGQLPYPKHLPAWISENDLDAFIAAFRVSGFRGGLNYYRNMDRNWRDQAVFTGLKVTVPALFMVGKRDPGNAIPGMQDIIKGMPGLVPHLKGVVVFPGAGHWLPQEIPELFNARLIDFLKKL